MATFTKDLANNYFERNPKFKTKQSVITLSNFLKNEQLKNVFEIGCHTGAQLFYLSMGNGTKGQGMDISPQAIAAGKEKYTDLNLVVGKCPDDFDGMIKDNSMDLIHVGFCFCYMSDTEVEETLRIALKKLKPGKFLSMEDFDSVSVKQCPRDGVTIYKREYSNLEGLKLLEKKVFYDDEALNNISYENEYDRRSIWLFKKK